MSTPDRHPTVVIAFGGNALQRPGQVGTVDEMRENLREALAPLRPLLESGARICITHGNGPQVGNALLRSEAAAAHGVPPHPLDVAVATTQAEIGSLVAGELDTVLALWGVARRTVVLLTHVIVDADDPALVRPSKPIGPFYDERTAGELRNERGWVLVEDAGRGWRRVVGSPEPRAVVELPSVRALLDLGSIVVCGGGGGIPVTFPGQDRAQRLIGVEAVIDKDRTAALLAGELGADRLVILTEVDAVYRDWGSPQAAALAELSVRDAHDLLSTGELPAGSMAPKLEAAADFAQRCGNVALITNGATLEAALAGGGGTRVVP